MPRDLHQHIESVFITIIIVHTRSTMNSGLTQPGTHFRGYDLEHTPQHLPRHTRALSTRTESQNESQPTNQVAGLFKQLDIRSMLEYTSNDTVTCLACFEHSILLKAQFAWRPVYPMKGISHPQSLKNAGFRLKPDEKAHSNADSVIK